MKTIVRGDLLAVKTKMAIKTMERLHNEIRTRLTTSEIMYAESLNPAIKEQVDRYARDLDVVSNSIKSLKEMRGTA